MKLKKSLAARLDNLETGVEKFEADAKEVLEETEHQLKDSWAQMDARQLVKDAGQGLASVASTIGAEAIGVAELFGFQYPVSRYEEKVSDGLTRGSRLDDDTHTYVHLKRRGFKSIVDLTLERSDAPHDLKRSGLNSLNVQILDNAAPTMAQMKQFLDFVTAPENVPAYVHCQAGVGRTGVAVAVYRMAVEGWPPEKAIEEAKDHGLALENQLEFLQQFGVALAAGQVEGYPLH